MIGEDDYGIYRKGTFAACVPERRAQQSHVVDKR